MCQSTKDILKNVNYKVTFGDGRSEMETNVVRNIQDQGILVFVKPYNGALHCYTNGGDDLTVISVMIGQKTVFELDHEEVSVNRFGARTLSCGPNGSPKPKITWFFNEEEISKVKRNFSYSEYDGGLTIGDAIDLDKNANNKHAEGFFRCQASQENLGITANKTFNVKALGKMKLLMQIYEF